MRTFEELQRALEEIKHKEQYATHRSVNTEYAKPQKVNDIQKLVSNNTETEVPAPYSRIEHFKQVEINALMNKPMADLLSGNGLERLTKLSPALAKKRMQDWQDIQAKK